MTTVIGGVEYQVLPSGALVRDLCSGKVGIFEPTGFLITVTDILPSAKEAVFAAEDYLENMHPGQSYAEVCQELGVTDSDDALTLTFQMLGLIEVDDNV